ncbi:CBS/PB1 domain-containing protein [Mucor ambiguus]|uniref:CBS/PB1 domain-containing protein n=1 Tax=Mucor ambiguus TaxID=91626 RepID=A0A0C9MA60_9FUNG|nr:CBS/PB1 domain-containing protein [Mucor ambiguus]
MSSSKRQTKVRAVESIENADSTGRQRQLKRDEAIRKKLEQDFSKKKGSSSRTLQSKRIPGTVSALRPGQALTVKENMLVIESAQLMAAKRCDCVLVINEDDHLSGIFTAKDIAYRLVAENLDAKTTPVIDIMTKNPMCVTSDTSATEALNLMVSKGFRHLPVCNEDGDIFGLLDITKCLYGALEKMERAFGSSRVLYDAIEGVEKEWAGTPAQLTEYMESLREKMSCPNLASVLDGTPPAEVKYRTNVRDIAIMMKELHTTAVLVQKHHNLAGIFTSKDIVLRVIAAGLNPENCTVVRVMTPNPDTATPETTVLDALKLMNEGHYLNLPVLDSGIVTGMVDVLKLTYVTLEQMSSMEGKEGEGPMWGRFWDSFGAVDHAESSSQLSDTSSHQRSRSHLSNTISPQPSTSLSQLKSYSDISPNESASMVNQSSTVMEAASDTFTFKFTSTGQKTHRVVCKPLYNDLLEAVRVKLLPEHGDDVGEEEWLSMSYVDDEQDKVLISSDSDVVDAVQLALKLEQSNVKLIVHDQQLAAAAAAAAGMSPTPTTLSKLEMIDAEDETDVHVLNVQPKANKPKSIKKSAPAPATKNSLLLPAAIGFLGVVIVGVFVFSKVQKDQH